jgi:hypothetical protein
VAEKPGPPWFHRPFPQAVPPIQRPVAIAWRRAGRVATLPASKRHIERKAMNLLRNFEAVFIVALGMAISASYVVGASGEAAPTPQEISANIATPSKMAVVTISAKRMSAAEKQRSLEDERRLARQDAAAGKHS